MRNTSTMVTSTSRIQLPCPQVLVQVWVLDAEYKYKYLTLLEYQYEYEYWKIVPEFYSVRAQVPSTTSLNITWHKMPEEPLCSGQCHTVETHKHAQTFLVNCGNNLAYNTINGQFSAKHMKKTEQLGITMLINDNIQLKQNIEQIGFRLALITTNTLNWSNRFRQTVPYCRTGNREGSVPKLKFLSVEQCSLGCWQSEDIDVLNCFWLVERICSDTRDSDCHVPWISEAQPSTG